MVIGKIKKYLKDSIAKAKVVLAETKIKVRNLKDNNIYLATDYFEYGILGECKNRLKIILRLWPNNDYAEYLLGLVYILNREDEKAIKHLKKVKEEKQKYATKLIDIIGNNKAEKIIDAYKANQSLSNLESVIDNVKL